MPRTVHLLIALISVTVATMSAVRGVNAQQVDRQSRAYLELLGNGLLASVNVEHPVGPRATVRLGAGGMWLEGIKYVLAVGMVGWELTTGTHGVHVSAGAGVIHFNDVFLLEGAPAITGYGTAAVAYRYQPRPRGVFLQVAFTPVLAEGILIPWGGAGVGVAF